MTKFNIIDYDYETVMHCKSVQEAEMFVQHLHSLGMSWSSGRSYAEGSSWQPQDGGTCYSFLAGVRGQLNNYLDDGYTKILEFDNFDWNDTQGEIEIISYEDAMAFIT